MRKEWKLTDDLCPRCGNSVKVFTEVGLPENIFFNEERCECIECKLEGQTYVDEDGNGYILMYDYDE